MCWENLLAELSWIIIVNESAYTIKKNFYKFKFILEIKMATDILKLTTNMKRKALIKKLVTNYNRKKYLPVCVWQVFWGKVTLLPAYFK